MKTTPIALAALLLASAAGPPNLAASDYEPQPSREHSGVTAPSLDPTEGQTVSDEEFADWLHDAVGDTNFHSLIITFGQCYGGGMMDDITNKFADSPKPVNMTSGSKHDETSRSVTKTTTNGLVGGGSRWAVAYGAAHPGMRNGTNANPSEFVAYTNATTHPFWTNSLSQRSSQRLAINGGGSVLARARAGAAPVAQVIQSGRLLVAAEDRRDGTAASGQFIGSNAPPAQGPSPSEWARRVRRSI